jgi:UDPglucose--hexose-1-phosphate uridylyltransferase
MPRLVFSSLIVAFLAFRGFNRAVTTFPQNPVFRLDSLTGEWVAVAGSRQGRPNLPADDCPFCVGGLEAPEPYVVKAFENRWPIFGPPGGAAEVVLYTPEHDATMASLGVEGVRRVVDLWAERTEALLARPGVEYVLVFENRGAEVGATIAHPHGQIYAFPFVPPVPAREAEVFAAGPCPLCEPVPEELAVCAGRGWHAYVPFASGWPYGTLIVPDAHVAGLSDLDGEGRDGLAAALVDVLARYDRLFDRPFPYMLWIHPGHHLHVHVAPPRRGPETLRYVAAGEVGSGTLMNPVEPERAAAALRHA